MRLKSLRKHLPITATAVLIICVISVLATKPPAIPDKPAAAPVQPVKITNNFHKVFYNNKNTWAKNRWLGIKTLQNPNDVWITQEIIYETKPDFIIEAGTYHGGSALLWAMILEQVNPDGKVLTIDIKTPPPELFERTLYKERIEFILGSSTDPKIVESIAKRTAGKKVLVILDSDHRKKHVLAELNAYAPMIPVGGYLIVQDSNINGHPAFARFGAGPMEAIQEFMKSRDDFISDKSRERLLLTFNPNGFLKRVK